MKQETATNIKVLIVGFAIISAIAVMTLAIHEAIQEVKQHGVKNIAQQVWLGNEAVQK